MLIKKLSIGIFSLHAVIAVSSEKAGICRSVSVCLSACTVFSFMKTL